jgi:ribosomal subunit interface protein
MQIQIYASDVTHSSAIDEHVRAELDHALKRFNSQVTRVEAHLHDDNGPKSGKDKRCVLEVRLAGHQPMAVEGNAPDLYEAVRIAAGKLERAVAHKLDRHEAHKGRV